MRRGPRPVQLWPLQPASHPPGLWGKPLQATCVGRISVTSSPETLKGLVPSCDSNPEFVKRLKPARPPQRHLVLASSCFWLFPAAWSCIQALGRLHTFLPQDPGTCCSFPTRHTLPAPPSPPGPLNPPLPGPAEAPQTLHHRLLPLWLSLHSSGEILPAMSAFSLGPQHHKQTMGHFLIYPGAWRVLGLWQHFMNPGRLQD